MVDFERGAIDFDQQAKPGFLRPKGLVFFGDPIVFAEAEQYLILLVGQHDLL